MATMLEPKSDAARRPFAGIKVVDVDTHWSEPLDLWTKRAPPALAELVPQVHLKDGVRWWYIDGKPFGPVHHASALRADGHKMLGMDFWELGFDEIHGGAHDVKARLAMMDESGVHAQFVYPNVLGFGNTKAINFSTEARLAATQIYNDAAVEMQEESGGRLLPMILVPWWDMNEALAEVRRCHALGLKGINTNSDPQEAGLPNLSEEYWNPFWELCTELDMPINFHIGSSQTQNAWYGESPWPTMDRDQKLVVGGTMLFTGNGRIICNVIMSGLLERFPKLKFVSVESGVGWLPFLMENLDYAITQVSRDNIGGLTMLPSDYFRRNFAACFWFETKGLQYAVDVLGADNIMWETDFPHPTCLFPDALNVAVESLAGLSHEVQKKILSGNAARIYNLDL